MQQRGQGGGGGGWEQELAELPAPARQRSPRPKGCCMPEPRNRRVAHSPVMGVQDPASDTLLGGGGEAQRESRAGGGAGAQGGKLGQPGHAGAAGWELGECSALMRANASGGVGGVGACPPPRRRGPGVTGSCAHSPVTGTKREQPVQAGQVVPTQGTRSFLHPCRVKANKTLFNK